ncbi:UNVERIFIED_CONTAM: hypothetical protein ODX46_15010, partial [Salmonella enterica subsp. enterica serovar Enteritidis]
MIVSALIKLFQVSNLRHVVTAIALIGVLTLVFWLIGPSLKPLGNINLLFFFVGVVAALVLSGVPIAFSFGLATFGYLALTTNVPMIVVIGRMDEGMSHLILLAV